ncbi:MFS transporter [Solicola gregarius]|uniref:MFS transporter n=1 Tax=Solicola gregarius TaxID=2908642 RepID=A0AA46TJT2_9ACTN|nr:MFS transporter [Solicola gregarius]UYM06184.1 MFS transporter [Solicola gregarius]
MGTFAVGTDAFIVAGFLPSIADSLDVSRAAAGQSITVFAIAYAVLSPVIATATNRIPPRTLLTWALVVLAIANVGSALAPSFAVLIATRVLAAAGAAAYTPNAGAVSASLVRPEQRARALAVVVGGLTIATALGVPLGNLAARELGWRTALGAVAGLGLVAAIGVLATTPVLPARPYVALRTRLSVLRNPKVIAVLPLTVLGMGASYTLYAYSVPTLGALDAGGSATMWLLFAYGVGAVVGNFAAGVGTDRWGAGRVLASGYVVMTACLATFALCVVAELHILALTALLMLAWGASSWCQTPPQQHRLIAAAPDATPLVVGLNSSAIYAGIGLGTLLGGATLSHGLGVTATLGAALAALSGAYLVLTARRR